MTDTITLPRKHIDYAAHALEHFNKDAPDPLVSETIHHLRTALAAEQPKQEPVAWMYINLDGECEQIEYGTPPTDDDSITPLYTAPPDAPTVKESLTHPGYIIGNHWFETAYERLCAGEAEDAILEDYELVREPRLRDLRRDAERYRWLRDKAPPDIGDMASVRDSHDPSEIDAAIDAAMENKP